MRQAFNSELRLGYFPIDEVELNVNCRDEIIPILRALQHIYKDAKLRREIVGLVAEDVNATTSDDLGRPGLDYWPIIVLAGVRLGCNLDYDKLQDLAEQHRNLRLLMGIGDWDKVEDFDWRRIRANLCLLRPKTLVKLNQLIVGTGHKLKPQAVKAVRGDSFVVETNIHYPTESSLIGDGLRKVVRLAAELAVAHGRPGWRQHEHLLKNIKDIVREVSQASRSKRQGANRVKRGYQKLLRFAEDLMDRARQLLATLIFQVEPREKDRVAAGAELKLCHYLELTEKVCGTAKRRVLLGETVPNEEKIFSIFEPHTELIMRGKLPNPIQYGHRVLVIEDAVGFICHYEVVAHGVLDQDLVVPTMKKLQKRLGGKIERASFDRAFHTPENQEELAQIVAHPCIPKKGQNLGRQQQKEATVEFREARQSHPGIESAIGALQAGNGLERSRDKSELGYERYVGLGILGRNLQALGKLLLAQDNAKCEAAKSKRKKKTG